MYTYFNKNEVETKLSKHYRDSVVVWMENGSPAVFIKVGSNGITKKDVNEIAELMGGGYNCGFVDYGCLMAFGSKDDMEEYRRTHI